MAKKKTLGEYMKGVPSERKSKLMELRRWMKTHLPEAKETMTYNMPTYVVDGEPVCAVANQKNYMSLYIMPYDLMNKKFEKELKGYNCGKSCIRFKDFDGKDLKLFARIVKFCDKNYRKSAFYGRM